MDDRSARPVGEPCQRWRVVFAHDAEAQDSARLDHVVVWSAGLSAAGLPVAMGAGKSGRARISFGAPVPPGMAAEQELADVVLTERRTRTDVAERLKRGLPAGDRLIDLYDVWLGEPALAGRVVAADFRVTVRTRDGAAIAAACAALLAEPALERTRAKGAGRDVTYDLRPLVLDLTTGPADPAGSADEVEIRMRLRIAQDGAAGRPSEVVAALGEAIGTPLDVSATVRERLLTA